jgi:hypothetical protein
MARRVSTRPCAVAATGSGMGQGPRLAHRSRQSIRAGQGLTGLEAGARRRR